MNILIVDDEALMRTSLQLYLETNQVPNNCIFHAENTTSMLEIFNAQKIDIAFVDIRMPGTDGLTAINAGKKIQPETHFYVLTGYSEFEYAHKALQLHIEDYLLKPVSPSQIQDILQKERAYIQAKTVQRHDNYIQVMKQTINNQATAPIEASAILACFSGEMNTDAWQKLIDRICVYLEHDFHLEIIKCSFLCWDYFIMQQLADFDKMKAILDKTIRQLPCNALLKYSSNDTVITLQSVQSESLQMIAAPYGCCYTSVANYPLSAKIGDYFGKLLYWSSERNFDQFCLTSSQFATALCQWKRLQETPQNQTIAILNHHFSNSHYKAVCIDDVPQLLSVYAASCLLCSSATSSNLNSIRQYIELHYQEKITLPMLAKQFGYTPNYISSAFRNQTGNTVTQYLNQVRLSNSCKLLSETNMSIQEISEFVGYTDSNYFARMFTHYYQCSPSLYRKKNSRLSRLENRC